MEYELNDPTLVPKGDITLRRFLLKNEDTLKDINDWVDKYVVDEGNHFELVSKIADKLFIVE